MLNPTNVGSANLSHVQNPKKIDPSVLVVALSHYCICFQPPADLISSFADAVVGSRILLR